MPNAIDSTDKATILVVDDTADIRTLMTTLLEKDYKVMVADNGEDALRLARSDTPPDLILLDVMMPEMDGYETCRQLKANPRTRDIPVIFLTAMAGEGNALQGRALGAVDYLSKPIHPDIMMTRVKNHILALRQKRRELESLRADPPPLGT